jgi:hypothetical protein
VTGAPALDALRASLDRLRDDGLALRLPDGATVELIEAPARPSCPSCGAVLTEDSDGNCLVCGATAHNPGARVVATGGGR